MNSYINIDRNANIRKERAGRAAYAITETCALLVCAVLNALLSVVSILRNDAVRLTLRVAGALCTVAVLFMTVSALELGEISFLRGFVRSALTCAACYLVFRIFGDE